MSADQLDYGGMMQRALRRVMAEALGVVAHEGLPGQHHFYITFDTNAPGVDMPDWLRERYPKDITIVLENEFWDFAVAGDRFSISLSFADRPASLVVPFDAVTTFVDPHAEFGLKFDAHEVGEDPGETAPRARDGAESDNGGGDGAAPGDGDDGGGDVVKLDSFRKP